MENAGYILAAFSVVWVIFFVYVLILIKGQRRLKREIEFLKESLKEKGANE